jgi:hypothetical protein
VIGSAGHSTLSIAPHECGTSRARSRLDLSSRAAIDHCAPETVALYRRAALEAAGRPASSVIGGRGTKNPDTSYVW